MLSIEQDKSYSIRLLDDGNNHVVRDVQPAILSQSSRQRRNLRRRARLKKIRSEKKLEAFARRITEAQVK